MAVQNSEGANSAVSLSQKLNKMIAGGSLDYNSWRSLILEIETASPEDINTISLAYDSFLATFPLCHWHLEKYAYQKAKLCSPQEAVNIYERGVETAMFSVGFWVDYFTFATTCFGGPEDVRRLFRRAVSFVGKDYLCHLLWDKYMKYEFNQEGWSFLAQSYIEALRFPTKKLHFYYNNFRQFVANLEEEMGYEKNNSIIEQASLPCAETEKSIDEISLVIKNLLDSSDRCLKSKALDRYKSIGEEFYLEACQMDGKIKCFETKVVRRYFYVTPLDDDQLKNWHLYLDFIEKQDNSDWAIKLYERCLIPCANYPEFWMRYVEFLEAKGGCELAISALDRATHIFLKNVADIHLFNARFKEHIGDINGARGALVLCDTKIDSSFIENVVTLANLERRLGNSAAASATYEKALKKAREEQKLHVLPILYPQFARLTFLITGNAAAARDVLIEGVRHMPHCRFLVEELIKFAMTHEGERQVNTLEPIIADAISPGLDEYEGLNAKDRESISCLFLELVNLCGTMHDIRKAWNRHTKLFPHLLRKHTRGNYSIRNKKCKYDPSPGHNQPHRNPSFDDRLQLQEVRELSVNDEIHPSQVSGNLSPRKDLMFNTSKETVQVLCTKDVNLSDGDASKEKLPSKENAFSTHEYDSHQKTGQMNGDELAKQSKENALSPHELAYEEVGKSRETREFVEASHSSLMYDHPELDHEFKKQRHPADISLNSQEKESRELIPPMSRESTQLKDFGPKGIQTESPQVHNSELERDGSASHRHNRPANLHSTGKDSIKIDDNIISHATSGFQEHSQVGLVQDDKATDQDRPMPVSYPQQDMNQQVTSSLSSQHPWQAQQSMLLQYYYQQQQQLLQQQYQQHLQMQHAYYQVQPHYMNQHQSYQQQPHQQQYVQQQQHQSLSYQMQEQIPGHVQLQQGQEEPHLNSQQFNQSQDLSYQLAYQQHATQGQHHLLLQQYQQQYQGYQHQQHSKEGATHMQDQTIYQHPAPDKQNEIVQHHHQQVSLKQYPTENMSQNQMGSKTSTPDYDGAAKPSESPHLMAQSPQILQ